MPQKYFHKKFINLLFIFITASASLFAQSNSDDYWLNHGFTTGQTVITNTGKFYDDGGFDKYHAGQNWTVKFCSENGNPITLDFSGFRTNYQGTHIAGDWVNWDYMTINYPGNSYVAYHNDTPQFSFTSPSGCITFGLITKPTSPLDSGWIAEISANPPPSNNDPCTAASLIVGNSCSPQFFSNKGAYNTTTLGSPPCHTYFGGDVWFKATVPASGQLKIQSLPGTMTYAIMDIFQSTSCAGLTRITCVDNLNSMPSIVLTGRTPGEVIYIRIFGDQAKSGTFGMCATDPLAPVNGYTGPGGVGDSITNVVWLRADAGILNASDLPAVNGEAVKTWKDNSGNLNNLVQNTATDRPLLNTTGLNSMPELVFDGAGDRFFREIGSISAPLMVYTIASFSSNANQSLLSVGDANITNTFSISRDASQNYYSFTGAARTGPALSISTPYLIRAYHASSAPFHRLKLGITSQTVTDYSAPALSTDGSFNMGANRLGAETFNGKVSEVILYNKALNTAQERIVNNYLSSKYGIDISTSDVYPYEPGYKNDVAGIGRIDASNTHTKAQSAGILSIGGPNDLGDGEFLMFGHDGGSISTWVSANIPSSDPNILRLSRTWRVKQSGGNGSVGQVSVGISSKLLPANTSGFLSYNIFVDADGDFTSGATAYGTIYSGTEYVANNVTLPDGCYIMIGIVKPYVSFNLASSSGFENIANPSISLSLNYAISSPFTVNYSVPGGTATGGGVDYTLSPNVVSFIPGQKTAVIQPSIVDDKIVEIPDEYFDISLATPTAGVLLGSQSTHRYTIKNNDVGIVITSSTTTIGTCASSTASLTATATGSGPFTYSWAPATGLSSPGTATTSAKPASTQKYKVTITDTNGFSNVDSVTITVVPALAKPVITVTGSLTFCSGDSIKLTSSAASSWLWSNAKTTQAIYVTNSGTFNVIAYDSYGCPSPVSDNVVTVAQTLGTPVFTLGATSTRCQGVGSVTYTATATNTTGITYSLDASSLGAGNTIVAATGAVSYVAGWTGTSVITASAAGCFGPKTAVHTVTITPTVSTPVFTLGATSTRCQGAGSLMYTATASNSTGMTYSLDGTSTGAGNSINASNGTVSYVAGWSGTSVVTASAAGCNGPVTSIHTITTTPTVSAPVFTDGMTSTRCQGAGSVTYSATATNSTGITYSLDGTSTGAGNSINASNGTVSYVAGWSGTSVVTASAAGCNGPVTSTHTITTTPTVSTPVFTLGATSTRCQGAGSLMYTATASNTTGITYSLDGTSTGAGNSINATDGTVSYVAGWSGTSVVTASAAGCNGPVTSTHTITSTPTVSTPVFTLGATSTRCQGAGSVTYTATATNSTGITYSLDGTSTGAGNSINATDGTVSYVAGWSGTSVVTASAAGCNGPVTSTHTITTTPTVSVPVFTLGATSTRCQGSGSLMYTATAANSTGITYSLDGTSTGAGNSINASNGTVSYVAGWSGTSVVTASAAGCNGPVTSTHTITTTPTVSVPVFTLGATSTRCQGAGSVTYTATASNSTGITYSLDGSSTGAGNSINASNGTVSYVAGWSGTSVVTASAAGCNGPVTSTHTITITPSVGTPVFALGSGSSRCQGTGSVIYTATASNSTGLSYSLDAVSSGAGNSINASDGTVSYMAGWSGNSTITATATGCNGPVSASHLVTTNPLPAAVSGADRSICLNESTSLGSTAVSGNTYSWSSTPAGFTSALSDPLVTPASSTTYTLLETVTATGCSKSNSVTVTVLALPIKPVVTASGATTFCEGQNVDLETGVASSYLWSNGETTQKITVDAAGSYSVQVSDGTCLSPSSDPVAITVNAIPSKPTVLANGPVSFCEGGSVILEAPVAASYLWSGGEISQSITVSASGDYSVQVSDGNCSSPVSDPVTVTVNLNPAKPVITVAGSTSICEGETVELSSSPASSYLWSNGETTQSISPGTAGSYSVIITDANSCSSPVSDPVNLTVNSLPATPVVSVGGSLDFCPGGSVVLTAPLSDGYLWSSGETSQSVTVSQSGSYSLQVSDANSCLSLSSLPVNVNVYPAPEKPVITPSGIVTIITGDNITLSSSSANSYLWTPGGEITRDIVVNSAGFYSVVVTDLNNCSSVSSDAVEVVVKTKLDKPMVSLSADPDLCEGESLTLTSEPAASYLWSTGATSQNIIVTTAGTYNLVVFNSNGISSENSDDVIVTINPNPQISIETTDALCFGSSDGTASAVLISGTPNMTYLWSNSTTGQVAGGLKAGIYSLTATDMNGCKASISTEIKQPEKLDISFNMQLPVCPDAADGQIEIMVTGGTGSYAYSWDKVSASTAIINDLSPDTYTVSVTDENSCTLAKAIQLGFQNETCIKVPGIITPNNDGYNDTWVIEGLDLYEGNSVEIYNRYGKLIFYMRSYDNSWDGTYEGKELPMESYHYVINLNNGTPVLKGNITIVR
ncbi:MAG: T9SS type B sorting domain-containing protein [Bacteroidales bacterium]|nr:T9SS type B sorting domain-containing protein [Bacteroidales bacterium]